MAFVSIPLSDPLNPHDAGTSYATEKDRQTYNTQYSVHTCKIIRIRLATLYRATTSSCYCVNKRKEKQQFLLQESNDCAEMVIRSQITKQLVFTLRSKAT